MSDENDIDRPEQSGDDEHDEHNKDADLDLSSDVLFRVESPAKQDTTMETALKVFGLAYMTLLLAALTLRIFERKDRRHR